VGVTEPAVFYYFKNKQSLFSAILEAAAEIYFQRIDALDFDSCEPFGCLEALIRIHFAIVAEKPEHMRILLAYLPGTPGRSGKYLHENLQRGAVQTERDVDQNSRERHGDLGEFIPVEIDATANMLIAMLNGLMRQQVAEMDVLVGVEEATVAFCQCSR
jgi:AcrR family transcriptional regulator